MARIDWRDSFGTILDHSLCGDDTQLCGVHVDVQGESRFEDHLAFVGQEIMQAEQTAVNQGSAFVPARGTASRPFVNPESTPPLASSAEVGGQP